MISFLTFYDPMFIDFSFRKRNLFDRFNKKPAKKYRNAKCMCNKFSKDYNIKAVKIVLNVQVLDPIQLSKMWLDNYSVRYLDPQPSVLYQLIIDRDVFRQAIINHLENIA